MKGKKKVRIVKSSSLLTGTPLKRRTNPQINKCLTCKKPAKECKGNCKYGEPNE